MQKVSSVLVGLFFLLGVIVLIVVFDLIKGGKGLQKAYDLKARFQTVQELKVGDPVKEAGVEIGQVKSIAIVQTNVEITLAIRRDVAVREDAVASVKSMGLFGQNYIGLTFGSATTGRLEAGSYVHTEERADFDQLVARMDKV